MAKECLGKKITPQPKATAVTTVTVTVPWGGWKKVVAKGQKSKAGHPPPPRELGPTEAAVPI